MIVFGLLSLLFSMCFFPQPQCLEYYEGTATFRNYGKVDLNWMVQLLPYNPIIIEAGAYTGDEILYAAKVWPESSKIIAFEPNPRAFEMLQRAIQKSENRKIHAYNLALNNYTGTTTLHLCHGIFGNEPAYEAESSLLTPIKEMKFHFQGPKIHVRCATLDQWCQENNIEHIDLLKIGVEGAELLVLQGATNMLKNTKVLVVQTYFHVTRIGAPNYFALKDFLTKANFVPLAHWYDPNGKGTAVYVSGELYDAYFVRCLGLGLGGLSYP